MLSRVAERLYWMARYLERAENTARLLSVHHGLLLDLPADASIGWEPLLDILGCRKAYDSLPAAPAIQSYLIADADHPSSLLSSLREARENARTTRDLIPTEAWRTINELHLYAQKQLPRDLERERHEVLGQIVRRCQTISGLLAGTMSQGPSYQFIRVGRNLERADMTTRLIDTAAAILMPERPELSRYDNTLWMAILRSLSAYQMYRQYVRRRVFGPDVIAYLLQDEDFPRAVVHCLREVIRSLRLLPKPEAALQAAEMVVARLRELDTSRADLGAIHQLVDDLQLEIGSVHQAIDATWFLPDEVSG